MIQRAASFPAPRRLCPYPPEARQLVLRHWDKWKLDSSLSWSLLFSGGLGMALFSTSHWFLRLDVERRTALGLPAPTRVPVPGRSGPAKVLTPMVMAKLAAIVEQRRRDIDAGRVRFECTYGDTCTAADAIRSFALDELKLRLLRDGNHDPSEVEQIIEECRRSDDFRRRVRGHAVALSRAVSPD